MLRLIPPRTRLLGCQMSVSSSSYEFKKFRPLTSLVGMILPSVLSFVGIFVTVTEPAQERNGACACKLARIPSVAI